MFIELRSSLLSDFHLACGFAADSGRVVCDGGLIGSPHRRMVSSSLSQCKVRLPIIGGISKSAISSMRDLPSQRLPHR